VRPLRYAADLARRHGAALVPVLAWVPPWSVHNGGPVEVTVTVRLQPTATGTRLSSDFEAQPHGFFRLIFPLFLIKIRKEEAANMTHLKAALERRAAADQAS